MAPVAAEQGMTGMVWGVNEDIGGYGDMALRWSKEELVDVDKEGRYARQDVCVCVCVCVCVSL